MEAKSNESAAIIEMVTVGQSTFPVEIRQDCVCVNLTAMGEPFGSHKRPSNWLRTKEAEEYTAILSDAHFCASDKMLVEVKKGGEPNMQGTWCYDYRIALQYARWLDLRFSMLIDDVMVRLVSGQAVFTNSIKVNGKEYISLESYCKHFNKNRNSFYSLMGHFPSAFITKESGFYIEVELCDMQEIKRRLKAQRLRFKKRDEDPQQLSLFEPT